MIGLNSFQNYCNSHTWQSITEILITKISLNNLYIVYYSLIQTDFLNLWIENEHIIMTLK